MCAVEMKSAFLLTAILSGLCAEVMASPIGDIDYDNQTAPMIEPDLHVNAESLEEVFPNVVPDPDAIEADPRGLVATDFDPVIDESQFALDLNQSSGHLGVPEPPPATLILMGLASLAFFALGRRARWKRRRLRRRVVVRMRAIMAER
jgi:hypothetical protein